MTEIDTAHHHAAEPNEPDPVERRIAGYRPSEANRRTTLGDAGLDLVRSAVRATKPATPDEASRLLCHTANHVARAMAAGHAPRTATIFSAPVVAQTSAAVRDVIGSKASPFIAHVGRVARAACPKGGHPATTTITQPPLQGPYTSQEQKALVAAAAGMAPSQRTSYLSALSLGFGAGLVGPVADALDATSLRNHDGHLLVTRPDGVVVAVLDDWAANLRGAVQPSGSLTEAYSPDGRQRLLRSMERATGIPRLDARRIRTTWICALLANGVPIDVVAHAAGVAPWTIASKYGDLIPESTAADLHHWLTSDQRARPGAVLRDPPTAPAVSTTPHPGPVPATDALDTYRPATPEVAELWSGAIGRDLRRLILHSTSDARRAVRLAIAGAALIGWAREKPELRMQALVLLRDSTIERFCQRRALNDPATAASYRALLRDLSTTAGLRPPAGTETIREYAAPYDDEEVEALLAIRLDEAEQRILDGVLVCGLGAGATSAEARGALGSDLLNREFPYVRFGDRAVPVDRRVHGRWYAVRQVDETCPLVGSRRRLRRALDQAHAASGVEVVHGRLRATWLVRHLERGVPYAVLAAAAGTKVAELNSLLAHVKPRSPGDVLGWLSTGRSGLGGS